MIHCLLFFPFVEFEILSLPDSLIIKSVWNLLICLNNFLWIFDLVFLLLLLNKTRKRILDYSSTEYLVNKKYSPKNVDSKYDVNTFTHFGFEIFDFCGLNSILISFDLLIIYWI